MSSPASDLKAQRADLLRYVDRRVSDSALSEDIVQEAYLRLLAYEAKPGGIVSNAAALLRRISLNLARDHYRHSGRMRAVGEPSENVVCPYPTPEEVLDYRQRVDVMARALGAMPSLRREIFLRNRFDGQTAPEIAAELEMSRAAVDKHIVRALSDIRQALAKRGLALWANGR